MPSLPWRVHRALAPGGLNCAAYQLSKTTRTSSVLNCNNLISSAPTDSLQYAIPSNGSHILSLLPTEPPNTSLAIGTTTKLPPTTDSLRENPRFLEILQSVFREHSHQDPDAISQAQVMVSISGANLSSGGVLLTGGRGRRRRDSADSSGGASGQGGAGSAGRGGWIHMSDERRPPEYGRIAWPEDIFGSLEVDADGTFVGGNGNYQPSGL